MGISDWSSDVCSSDLGAAANVLRHNERKEGADATATPRDQKHGFRVLSRISGNSVRRDRFRGRAKRQRQRRQASRPCVRGRRPELGSASCRARWGRYVSITGCAVTFKKKKNTQ